jgi:hypothetical protein
MRRAHARDIDSIDPSHPDRTEPEGSGKRGGGEPRPKPVEVEAARGERIKVGRVSRAIFKKRSDEGWAWGTRSLEKAAS